MNGPAVAVEKLRKSYGGRRVLEIETLAFEAGGVHVVVGPNGAGKSTLLRIANGLERPDSGKVRVLGGELWALPGRERLELRRRMAFCAQKAYLFQTTVRRNVEYPLRVRGVPTPERARRAGAAMEKLGVSSLAERDARGLSAGESQRAALARGTVSEPELLLLDEPLANIDPVGVPRVEELLRELVSSGTTVIVATHVLEQAYHLSADVVRLEGGRVAPPAIENLLKGELVGEASGAVLHLAGGGGGGGGRGGGGRVHVSTERRGPARGAIEPRDVVVSAEKLDSSARNSLKGRVIALRERGGSVFVTADVGFELTSCITPQSCRRLNLTIGSEAFFTFKATAVKVF